jgi:UDP-glucose 4-epimerase
VRILVTGGGGYIGSHTVLALLETGFDVVVMDNFGNSDPEALVRVQALAGRTAEVNWGDVRDRCFLRRVFSGARIDAVIHFAAHKAVGESVALPLEYYENNIVSLLGLLEVMRDAGCHRLIFSSSATVYGTASEPPFSETAPLGASSPYGRTKLFAEEILRDVAAADARWKIALLRYFNPVGAHASGQIGEMPQGTPNNLFPYVTQVAIGARPHLRVFGDDYPTPDGTGVRDYIHVCDLGEGHVAAVAALDRIQGAEAINLGTGRGYSVLEVIRAFEAASGRAVPFEIVARRPGDVAVSLADPRKAATLLGWTARRDLTAMCEDGWRWQQMNPMGFGEPAVALANSAAKFQALGD